MITENGNLVIIWYIMNGSRTCDKTVIAEAEWGFVDMLNMWLIPMAFSAHTGLAAVPRKTDVRITLLMMLLVWSHCSLIPISMDSTTERFAGAVMLLKALMTDGAAGTLFCGRYKYCKVRVS
jgi:hypothetical protein